MRIQAEIYQEDREREVQAEEMLDNPLEWRVKYPEVRENKKGRQHPGKEMRTFSYVILDAAES